MSEGLSGRIKVKSVPERREGGGGRCEEDEQVSDRVAHAVDPGLVLKRNRKPLKGLTRGVL